MPGSVGSGRKRRPQIEQAYSPVHMCLPSRFVITALRQTLFAGILKAYIDSRNAIEKKKGSQCTLSESLMLTKSFLGVCPAERRIALIISASPVRGERT